MDKVDFTTHFHEAVDSGRIRAYFQPVIRSLTQRIMGVESLARWFKPDGCMLSPAEFIPDLERYDLIHELDMEILRQACVLYDDLRRRGTPISCVSVNFSRLDFARDDLFEKICAVLEAYKVPREAIHLEITESLMLDDAESFERTFRRFKEAGFSVWLDDFGSGYSSLNVLQNYSFNVIKFDMLFLRKLSIRGRNMLASLVGMAKTLGIHTLTEGVETIEQRKFLVDIGCEAQQGFYYARPLPKENLIGLIDQNPERLETGEDKKYWDEIGRVNFVNPNPLKAYADRRGGQRDYRFSSYDGSVALVECSKEHTNYIYATEGYKERLRELGFSSVGGLENALANQQTGQFMMLQKVVLDALKSGTVQTVEYAYKDVYYRLSALFIARRQGRAMILMRLNTFEADREVETAREMLNSSSALLSTYDLVVMFYPDRKKAKRVYTRNNLPEYDREDSLQKSLQSFCEREIDPVDKERYLRFLDFETLEERIGSSPRRFIQSVFRMRLVKEKTGWYSARVTQINTLSEPAYMLTVQNIQDNMNYWIDTFAGEHPEVLK
ncbi:MAG: EAL domain-containing protein [Clostridia bacterium]|nr:EAL domain-containing protein [Clostridia bacterium]